MTKRTLRGRVDDLENAGSTDDAPQIVINWDPKPDHSHLKPGDIVITWGDDDEIKSQVIK